MYFYLNSCFLNRKLCYYEYMWWNKRKLTHYERLSKRWIKKHTRIQKNLWKQHGKALIHVQKNAKHFALSSLAGILLLITPANNLQLPLLKTVKEQPVVPDLNNQERFLVDLTDTVPAEVRELTPQEEATIAAILSEHTGMKVAPSLQGIRLNRTYGYIGKEQHLARYPGDTIAAHIDNPNNAAQVISDGMAPGLGGWGYFMTNGQFTPEDAQREKYYIAVQTFLAPGWSQNVASYSAFFKWRKMLVVNPQNGKALVAVIGDAGPAVWTGKSLGGSPEVMQYLERVDGAGKGPVLYFFIDDPNNQVPLGPVTLKN